MDAEKIQKLEKENRRLKTINVVLTIYVIVSAIVMVYNQFA